YQELPVFPAERLLWESANRALIQLDSAVEHFANLFTGHHLEEARLVAKTELQQAALLTVDAIMINIEFDAKQSHDRAQRISHVRAGLERTAVFLNVLCVLWTAAAAMVLILSIRRRTALREEQRQLALERAEELEQFAGRVAHDIL